MFFYVSKIAWIILQPSNVLLFMVLAAAAALFTSGLQRFARPLLVTAAAGYVVLGFSPLSGALLSGLENRFQRSDLTRGPPVAGIIILGGAEDGRAGPQRELAGLNEAAERLTEGAALGLRFTSAKVVFTGGSGLLLDAMAPQGATASGLLRALGIDNERLIIEDKARNTWENAVLTKAMINPKPGERWLLVTSAFHMPRAIGCFRTVGIAVEPWPVDYRTNGALSFADSYINGMRQLDFIVREYIGLVAYYLTRKTTALLPAP